MSEHASVHQRIHYWNQSLQGWVHSAKWSSQTYDRLIALYEQSGDRTWLEQAQGIARLLYRDLEGLDRNNEYLDNLELEAGY